MGLGLYTSKNYKEALRLRLKEQQKKNRSLTLRKIADIIPVQYTYLSKVLNHDEFHLNEDHLFTICRTLSLDLEETEYMMILRGWMVAQDPERKKYLFHQLEKKRSEKKLSVQQKESNSEKLAIEINYLLNPLCILVHVAMSNLILRKNPQALCSKLGINLKQLKEILKILSMNDMLEIEKDQITVIKTNQVQHHLGTNHPLMRFHQNLLKTQAINRLSQTEEENKKSFQVTFTLNDERFEKIKQEFLTFIKKVEDIARSNQRPQDNDQVYYLNFDFFRWL